MSRIVRSGSNLIDENVIVLSDKHLNSKNASSPELLNHTDSNLLGTLGYSIGGVAWRHVHARTDIVLMDSLHGGVWHQTLCLTIGVLCADDDDGQLTLEGDVLFGIALVDDNLALLAQLLENGSLDVFRLYTEDLAVRGKFPDLGGVLERSVDVVLAAGDLFGWGVLSIEDGDFNFEG
ncbi:hypothetical protein HG531_013102 [Fusarium graminearum]|nr:hypothetical protein HG531_013102 [Fusarium graminearum]